MLSAAMNSISKESLDRKCSMKVHNLNPHMKLDTPSYYIIHGHAESAIVPEIVNGEMQALEFAKTQCSPHGLNGVLVYRIKFASQQPNATDDHALAIMWNIPSVMKPDRKNSFAVGISSGLVADRELYKLMANGSEDWFQRKTTDTCKIDKAIGDKKVHISATLSDANSAILSLMIK